jgi:putative spermidine/putrescine transport system permease protein
VNSIKVGLLATLISTVAGAAAALYLYRFRAQLGRWGNFVEVLLLSPKFIPTVVVGFALLVFSAKAGLDSSFARLVAGHVIITIPFTIRATLAALAGIRPAMIEAAMTLGASEGRAYFDVVLPLARGGVGAGALFAFVLSFDEVAVSLFLADPSTTTLPVALIAEMRANLNLTVAAVSVILVACTALIIIALERWVGLDRVAGQGVYGK